MDCASGFVKILLTIFNLVFFLTGLAFVSLGILFVVDIDDVVNAIPDESLLNFAPISIIVIGAIILVISFFGCCGAIQKNTCMLKTYACILLVILIGQVAVGIYALVKINDTSFRQTIHNALEKAYKKYDPETKEFIDAMQVTFKCCGLNNADEWEQIPKSCYPTEGNQEHPFTEGCSQAVSNFLSHSYRIVGIVAVAVCLIEIFASIFAICLSGAINKEKGRIQY